VYESTRALVLGLCLTLGWFPLGVLAGEVRRALLTRRNP
jgi:hypothetical protein